MMFNDKFDLDFLIHLDEDYYYDECDHDQTHHDQMIMNYDSMIQMNYDYDNDKCDHDCKKHHDYYYSKSDYLTIMIIIL